MASRSRARPRRTPRLVSALRPTQWLHFTVLPLAGVDPRLPLWTSVASLTRGVLVASLVLAYGYLLNALSDREMDADRIKNPLVGLDGPSHRYWAAALGLALGAVALAATGPRVASAATLIALVSGAVYSVGPRLKSRPLVCTLLNVTCFAPLLFVGLGTSTVGSAGWALALVFSALLFQNQLLHEGADQAEDRKAGLRTSFLVLGPRGTALLGAVAGAVSVGGSAWLAAASGVSLLFAAHAIPLSCAVPVWLARDGHRPARMRRARRLHRLGALLAGALLFAIGLWGK